MPKRILCFLIATIMTLSMSLPVFATDNTSTSIAVDVNPWGVAGYTLDFWQSVINSGGGSPSTGDITGDKIDHLNYHFSAWSYIDKWHTKYTIYFKRKPKIVCGIGWNSGYAFDYHDDIYSVKTNTQTGQSVCTFYKSEIADFPGSYGSTIGLNLCDNDGTFPSASRLQDYGSSYLKGANFAYSMPDGTTVEPGIPGATDDNPFGFDPLPQFPTFLTPDQLDTDKDGFVNPVEAVMGLIVNSLKFFTWLGDFLKTAFDNFIKFCNNLVKVVLVALENLIKKLFVPNPANLNTLCQEKLIVPNSALLKSYQSILAEFDYLFSTVKDSTPPSIDFVFMNTPCNLDFAFMDPIIGVVRTFIGSLLIFSQCYWFYRRLPGLIGKVPTIHVKSDSK